MKTTNVIEALSALAHEHRLATYRLLVQRGPEGLPAGVIAERLGLLPSSLTFHLQSLQRAGLITQRRESRQLFYSVDFAVMRGLICYLTENCCGSSGAEPRPSRTPAKLAKRPGDRLDELPMTEARPRSK